MSKLIVNQLQPYSGSLITFVDSTNVTIGGTLAVTGTGTFTGGIAGTLSTAAQTNITSVGTLSTLAVSGNLTVDTNTLFVDAANNRAAIGTSSPDATFHISKGSIGDYMRVGGDDVDSDRGLLFTSSTTTSIGDTHTINARSANGRIAFATSFVERMRIDSSGRVGIGTSSPGAKLSIRTTANGGSDSHFGFGANNDIYLTYGDTGSTIFRTISSGGINVERLRIDSSGNVGIGTTTPTSKLHVVGDVNVSNTLLGKLPFLMVADAGGGRSYPDGTSDVVYTNTIHNHVITHNSNLNFNFTKTGFYRVTTTYRYGAGSDVWTSMSLVNTGTAGVLGTSHGTGQTLNDPATSVFDYIARIDTGDLNTTVRQRVTRSGSGFSLGNTAHGYELVTVVQFISNL